VRSLAGGLRVIEGLRLRPVVILTVGSVGFDKGPDLVVWGYVDGVRFPEGIRYEFGAGGIYCVGVMGLDLDPLGSFTIRAIEDILSGSDSEGCCFDLGVLLEARGFAPAIHIFHCGRLDFDGFEREFAKTLVHAGRGTAEIFDEGRLELEHVGLDPGLVTVVLYRFGCLVQEASYRVIGHA
jgi:hypothetical protein